MTEVAALGLSVDSGDVVSATGDLDKFAAASDKAGKASDGLTPKTKRTGDEIERTGGKAKKTTTIFGSLLKSITGLDLASMGLAGAAARLGGTLAAAFSVKAIIGYADAWSDMQSKVGAAVKDMSAAPELMGRMVDLANASYSPLDQTVEVYTRNVGVLRALGKSATEAADFTEALNHALVVTATRGERAASVQNALSKAMAVGKLQADGLETVMANGGRVAEALAERLGTNVNGLRAMASQGKITATVIAGALLDSLEKLRAEAAEMPATVADGMTRIGTGMQYLIGILDQTTGASGSLAGVLVLVGDALANAAKWASENGATIQFVFDSVIGTAIVGATALAVKFAATWAVSMYTSAAATGAFSKSLVILRGALIASGIGIAVVAAGVLVGQLLKVVQAAGGVGEAFTLIGAVITEAWSRATLMFDAMVARFNAGWLDIKADAADAMASAIEWVSMLPEKAVDAFKWAVESIATLFKNLPAMIGSAVVGAINFVIEKVEGLIQRAIDGVNKLIAGLNSIPGVDISEIGSAALGRVASGISDTLGTIEDFSLTGVAAGIRGNAAGMRGQADAYREAGRMLDRAAQQPMTAWERLKSIFTETDEVVKATTTDTTVLGDTLAGAGKKGKDALADVLKALRQEHEMLKATAGMSDLQASIWEKQREAKVKATSAAGKEIETLVTAIDRMKDLKSATEDFRSTMAQAFSGLVTGATSLRDAVGNIIGKLAEMAATRGFEFLWSGQGGKGGIGGAMGGFLGSLLGFADGGVFSGGRVTAFADGGVVNGPTVFPMAGGTGLMGEAGPEAIMPLKRGSDGKLGVKVSGGGSGARGPVEIILRAPAGFSAEQLGEIEGVSVRVVSEAAPQIVQQSVQSTGRAMSKTKAFGNGSI